METAVCVGRVSRVSRVSKVSCVSRVSCVSKVSCVSRVGEIVVGQHIEDGVTTGCWCLRSLCM